MQPNTFKCIDSITKQLLYNFKQKDFQEKILIKTENQLIVARTVNQLISDCEILSDSVYYYPTSFPLISRNNISAGSPWKNWKYPNFDTCFVFNNDRITVDTIHRDKISVNQYIEKLKIILDNNISKIFIKNKNKKIFLCYSGGIDSILILSYIIKKNLQDKIELINFSNLLTGKKNNTFNYEKKLGFKVKTIKIGMDAIINACNTKEKDIVVCYSTYNFLNLYKNTSFIFGFHGNQSLLHKKIFLEQINKDVKKDGYCKSLNNWKSKQNPTPLAEHSLLIKPWDKLNGINNCEIFAPLGNEEIFEMVRSIDWNHVDPHTISDAKVARQIIHDNVGNLLDSIILEEDTTELDVINGDLEVPMEKLDKEIFNIQEKSYYNKEGYNWLLSEYDCAKEKNSIKLNSLVSFLVTKKYF